MLIYAIVLIVMMLFNWSPQIIAWRERYSLKEFIRTRIAGRTIK
jgi:branched-chain amino acid transport system permease protein